MSSRAAREAEGSDWERTGRKTLSTITPRSIRRGGPRRVSRRSTRRCPTTRRRRRRTMTKRRSTTSSRWIWWCRARVRSCRRRGRRPHFPRLRAHRLEHRLVRRLVHRLVRPPENPRVHRPVPHPDHRPVHRPDRLRAHLRRMTRSLCLLLLDLPLRRILRRFPLLPVHLRAWRMRCPLFPLPRRRVLPRTLRRAWRRDPGWSRWSPSVWFPCPCLINRRHRRGSGRSRPRRPFPTRTIRSGPPRPARSRRRRLLARRRRLFRNWCRRSTTRRSRRSCPLRSGSSGRRRWCRRRSDRGF